MQSSNLKIDLDMIQNNIRQLARIGEVMAMVKANAYGTDVIQLAPYLIKFGVKLLGVSHVNEGVMLRKAGIHCPIFVLSAPPFDATNVAKYYLQPAVHSLKEIEALNHAAEKTIPVHLHVNTGMNRFGSPPKEALKLVDAIHNAPHLLLEGVMTHFSSADLPEMDSFTHRQIVSFKKVVDALDPLPRWVHAANGAGAVRFSLPFCNLIRVGSSLFNSALTFESHLSFISTPKKGEKIGYYGIHEVKRNTMRVGVIPVGYYDGLHRHYKEKGYVLICGKQAPMIGNICMDFMMVDLTDIPDARVGDLVTIFDAHALRPETVANWGNTDTRELISSIGPRTKRIFIRKKNEQRIPKPICHVEEDSSSRQYLLPT